MNFKSQFNLDHVKSLKDGPDSSALERAKSLFRPLLEGANEYRGLPEATDESLAKGAIIVQPDDIGARMDELKTAAQGAFNHRRLNGGDPFTPAEIGFMRDIETADVNLKSDPGSSHRRHLQGNLNEGRNPTGMGRSMSALMERYNSEGPKHHRDRVTVKVDHTMGQGMT